MIRHKTVVSILVILVVWSALAVWQWREFEHEQRAAQDTLVRQAESITAALIGGIRSHRRMGPFFQQQLQATLDGLITVDDIEAVALADAEGNVVLSAGAKKALPPADSHATICWQVDGLRYVRCFELPPPPGGVGMGGGFGRGLRAQVHFEHDGASPFASGGRFCVGLLLRRDWVDAQTRRAAWLRIGLTAAGGLLLVCLAAAWGVAVGAVDARARVRVLEAEARHLRQLHHSAAGLAHETRNPLGVIRGWAQQLSQAKNLTEKQREQAVAILEECDRLTSRINQFLCFARPREPSPTAVELGPLVEQLRLLLQPDLDAKQLTVRLHSPAAGVVVHADVEMLRQTLFNLLSNAIAFSPPGESIEVTVQPGRNGRWCLEVADRGPGVPEDQQERLFWPYHTTRPKGTGLGLAIVRQMAVAHGWQVGYRRREGGGAVFRVDQIEGLSKASE